MATTYDKASLVMIPSGYKDDKLYSIKPTDGSGDFTFSRDGSGASPATRVNSDGNIEKGRENTLLYSNDFDTGFSKTRASLVSGQAGYDGSNDAWAFVDDTNNSTHLIVQTISSSEVATFSVYAKAGAVDFLAMRYEDASVEYAYFDLGSGALGTIDSGYIDAKITDVGGGWYRCSATRTSANKVVILSAQADNDPTYAGAGTTAIYIQDAQLESGLVATDYIETTTTAVSAGLLGDMPRLDYSGGASCPSLLLEPSRTNLVTQSEYIGAWTKSTAAITITDNAITSPEGVQNAAYVQFTAGSQYIRIDASGSSATYTGSVYIKGTAGETIQLAVAGTDSGLKTLTGDWDRVEFTATGTTTHLLIHTFGGATARNIYVYGAQCEAGSYPTSYIPTYGSASLRAVDDIDTTYSTAFDTSSGGTILFHMKGTYNSGGDSQVPFRVRKDSGNYVGIGVSGSNWRTRITTSSSGTIADISSVSQTDDAKIAIAWGSTGYAIYVNGTEEDAGSTSIADIDEITDFFSSLNDNRGAHGMKQYLLIPSKLTNAELASLTTL